MSKKVTEESLEERLESLELTPKEREFYDKPFDPPDSMILHFKDLDRLQEYTDSEVRLLIDSLREFADSGALPDLSQYDRGMRDRWAEMSDRYMYDRRQKELTILNNRLSNIQKNRKQKDKKKDKDPEDPDEPPIGTDWNRTEPNGSLFDNDTVVDTQSVFSSVVPSVFPSVFPSGNGKGFKDGGMGETIKGETNIEDIEQHCREYGIDITKIPDSTIDVLLQSDNWIEQLHMVVETSYKDAMTDKYCYYRG